MLLTEVFNVASCCLEDAEAQESEHGDEGEVASFTIDDRSLVGRLVAGNKRVKRSPLGDMTFLSAYYTQAGYLNIATKIRTKDAPIYIHDAAAKYRAPNGRQRVLVGLGGPQEIGSGSTAMVTYSFKGPIALGGSMAVELNQKENSSEPATITLRIK